METSDYLLIGGAVLAIALIGSVKKTVSAVEAGAVTGLATSAAIGSGDSFGNWFAYSTPQTENIFSTIATDTNVLFTSLGNMFVSAIPSAQLAFLL